MIYVDFCALVESFADERGMPVAYPGRPFKNRPDTGQWLEVVWNRNGSEERLLSDANSAVHMGFFRVMVYDQVGESVVAAHNTLEAVVEAIPKGTPIGAAAITEAPSFSGPVIYDDRVMHMATFRYQTH